MPLKLQFLGAAQTVTGSRTLLSWKDRNYLIDCGLFQGPKERRRLNWEPFIDPSIVDGVILTHAHIDHSGYLPRFTKDGYKGPIYSSEGTYSLCRILLPDSAHLQEEDADFANVTGHSHHKPALPLYDIRDAERALKLFEPMKRNQWKQLSPELSFQFLRAGHIIGSSFVQMSFKREGGTGLISFTGDIGNGRSPTLTGPVNIRETDYLVLESTYGNRIQPRTSPEDELAGAVNRVTSRGGVLLIPAFSVGRTQDLLYLLRKLEDEGKIPAKIPVYLDSPLSIEATRIFNMFPEDHKVVIENGHVVSPVCPSCYKSVASTNESMELTQRKGPMIILSAAGMLSGGRILHHLKTRLPKKENGVLFVGYQAAETKGRLLQEGISELRIHHTPVPVRAEILTIDSLSAHADLGDIMEWLKGLQRAPRQIFINHGEPEASETLANSIRQDFGYNVVVPKLGETFELR